MKVETGLTSIPLPCYYWDKYLTDALDSCFAQDNVEVIAVDDASPTKTWKILKKYKTQHPDYRLTLIKHDKNLGENGARNTGIRASCGEFIAYMDCDDILTPDSIKLRREAFKPDIDIVCGYVRAFKANKQPSAKNPKYKQKYPEMGLLIRRRVFQTYGLFYEKLTHWADHEWWARTGLWHDKPKYRTDKIPPVRVESIDLCACYWRLHPKRLHRKYKSDKKLKTLLYKRIDMLKTEGLVDVEFLK